MREDIFGLLKEFYGDGAVVGCGGSAWCYGSGREREREMHVF